MTLHLFPFTLSSFFFSFLPTPPHFASPSVHPVWPPHLCQVLVCGCGHGSEQARPAVLLQPQSALQNGSFPNNSSSPDVIHPFHLFAVSRTTKPVVLSLSPERRVSKYHHVRCRAEQRRRRPTASQATQRLDPLPLRQAPTTSPTRPRTAKAYTGRSLKDHLRPMEDRVGRGPRHVR